MFRRRRRSSARWAGARRPGPIGLFLRYGLPAIVVIGAFMYLVNAADSVAPERHEARIDVSNALD